MVLDGRIKIKPAQDYACGCAACMVVSATMPVIVAEDPVYGGKGYAPIHPGANPKVLRWGLYDGEVEQDLCWMRDEFGPALGQAVRASGGIDLVTVLAKTAGMGDENHNRQPAASMYLALQIIPHFMDVEHPKKTIWFAFWRVMTVSFACDDGRCGGAYCESERDSPFHCDGRYGWKRRGIRYSTLWNGKPMVHCACPCHSWDAAETILYGRRSFGISGRQLCNGGIWSGRDVLHRGSGLCALYWSNLCRGKERTEKARAVSLGEHTFAPIPWDEYRGFPVGIDARKVVGYNILPISHGGSALKTGGQAGAGAAELPLECFREALRGIRDEALRKQQ